METLTLWNIRTGEHTRREGEVWREWDGPDFLGYYKCVRETDGKLKSVPATQEEYEQKR